MGNAIPTDITRVTYYFTKDGEIVESSSMTQLQRMLAIAIDDGSEVTEIKCKINRKIIKV